MSSLDTSVSVPDLEPTVSVRSRTANFVFPLLAALYSPDLLMAYLNRPIDASDEAGGNRDTSARAASLRIFVLTTITSLITVAVFCVIEMLFAQRIVFGLVDFLLGVIGIFFAGLVMLAFCALGEYSPLGLAVQAVWGLIGSVLLGIYAVHPVWHTFIGLSFFAAIGIGMQWGVMLNMESWYEEGQIPRLKLLLSSVSFAWLLFIGAVFVLVPGMVFSLGLEQFAFFMLAVLVGFGVFRLFSTRFDDWLFHRFDLLRYPNLSIYDISPRVGQRWVPELSERLENDLTQEWSKGVENCVKVLRYTNQRRTVLNAINTTLQENSRTADGQYESLVKDAEQLWQKMFHEPALIRVEPDNGSANDLSVAERRLPFSADDLRVFLPRPRTEGEDVRGIGSIKHIFKPITKRITALLRWLTILPKSQKPRSEELQQGRLKVTPRERARKPLPEKFTPNTDAEHAIAGLWYLEQLHPKEASEAFDSVTFSPLGAELKSIATTLEDLWCSENLPSVGSLKLPAKPDKAGHVDTWNALTNFRNIVRYAWVFKRCRDWRRMNMLAVMIDDEITALRNSPNAVLESGIIKAIASDWEGYATELLGAGNEALSAPKVQIPFIYNKPLTIDSKSLLKELRTAQAQLKEAWRPGDFQPVLITGQSQTGKTSLIRTSIPDNAALCLIEMQQLGVQPRPKKILQAICDELIRQNISRIPISEQFDIEPVRVFGEHIKDVCELLRPAGLIIALDEFEFLASRTSLKEVGELLSYLWSLARTLPNLSVALLTTITLPELNAQFNKPFTQSLQPITVGFLSEDGVAQLLRNPTPDFLPYCHDKAVQLIMEKTAGQPYLVQVCAAFLFSWYNRQVDTKANPNPLLTDEDVQAAMQHPQFKGQCKRYFLGVWAEAEQVNGELALPILRELAFAEFALSSSQILRQSKAPRRRIDDALELLGQHQIIEKVESGYTIIGASPRWRIKVPLFRNWLLNRT